MVPINWRDDVLIEKSMLSVFRASTRFSKSRFNRFIYIFSFIVLGGICAKWFYDGALADSYKALSTVSEIGFQLSIQILGFLIGGFAIFATVTDHRLMIKLAQAPMESQGSVSVFKYVFFNFLSVFSIFLVTLAITMTQKIIMSLGFDNLVISKCFPESAKLFVNCMAFYVTSFAAILCVVRLKSFIWNIYQAFLTFLRVSELLDKAEGEGKS